MSTYRPDPNGDLSEEEEDAILRADKADRKKKEEAKKYEDPVKYDELDLSQTDDICWKHIDSVPHKRKVLLRNKHFIYHGIFYRITLKGKYEFHIDAYSGPRVAEFWCDVPNSLLITPDPVIPEFDPEAFAAFILAKPK